MADQVTPLGSLAPGIAQTFQVTVKSPPAPDKTRPVKGPDSQAKALEGRAAGVSSKNSETLDGILKKVETFDEAEKKAETLDDAAKKVGDYLQQSPSDLAFKVDKDTGIPYFKIVNSVTHEVVRQVPSEEILAMARKLRELANTKDASGVLMDEEG